MDSDKDIDITTLLALSAKIGSEHSLKYTLISAYWRVMLAITSLFERIGYPRRPNTNGGGPRILNFGCGNHYVAAVNSDLFSPHRYLRRRKRPDLYLSGLNVPKGTLESFDAIVCEHVLEHMLPHQADTVLRNLRRMLKTGGKLQISVPSLDTMVECGTSTAHVNVTQANDMIYRYGHRFMHNEDSVCALLINAGFRDAAMNSYESSPYKHLLAQERVPQSIYVIAEK